MGVSHSREHVSPRARARSLLVLSPQGGVPSDSIAHDLDLPRSTTHWTILNKGLPASAILVDVQLGVLTAIRAGHWERRHCYLASDYRVEMESVPLAQTARCPDWCHLLRDMRPDGRRHHGIGLTFRDARQGILLRTRNWGVGHLTECQDPSNLICHSVTRVPLKGNYRSSSPYSGDRLSLDLTTVWVGIH